MPTARVRRIGRIRGIKQDALDDRARELAAAAEELSKAESRLEDCVATRVRAALSLDDARRRPIAPEDWKELEDWLATSRLREVAQRQRVAAHAQAVELARQAVVAAQSEVKRLDELIARIKAGEEAVEAGKERKLADELAARKRPG